jgi:hypothetical protein
MPVCRFQIYVRTPVRSSVWGYENQGDCIWQGCTITLEEVREGEGAGGWRPRGHHSADRSPNATALPSGALGAPPGSGP